MMTNKRIFYGILIIVVLAIVGTILFVSNRPIIPPAQDLMITTDKTEYEQEEKVKITITNNLNTLVWYAKRLDGCSYSFWELEKLEGDEWKEISYTPFILCFAVDYGITSMPSNKKLEDTWDGYIRGESVLGKIVADSEKYRIVFYYVMTENKPNAEEFFKSKKKVYSNEFTIK